jgi:hypothetical protein
MFLLCVTLCLVLVLLSLSAQMVWPVKTENLVVVAVVVAGLWITTLVLAVTVATVSV